MRRIVRDGKITAPPRIIKNYKFAVYLRENPPSEFWEQARSMNVLWNEMLDVREDLRATLKKFFLEERLKSSETSENKTAAESKDSATASTPEKRIRSEREKMLWQEFHQKLLEISVRPDWKQKLGNNARESVLDNFQTASIAAFRRKGNLRRKSTFLTRVAIPYRFTQGGWRVARLFARGSKKIHIDPLPEKVFTSTDWQSRRARMTTGFYGYGIDKQPLSFRILMHRPLPAQVLIKTTNLFGKYDSLTGTWSWYLLLACQSEPVAEIKSHKPAAAIDFGFRRMKDYLRIGYVADTAGYRYELKLPLIEQPSRRLLNAFRVVNDAREHQGLARLTLEEFYPVTFFDVQTWQKKRDSYFKETKQRIKEWVGESAGDPAEVWGDEVNDILKRLPAGVRRELFTLRKLTAAAELPRLRTLHELLTKWQENDLENLKKIRATRTYLINKRNKIYENIALWLKSNFSYLISNQNFSLRHIAEAAPKMSLNSGRAAMKGAAKYRYFAALFFLQKKIRERDSQGWLLKADILRPSATCYRCGAAGELTSKMEVVCPNNHQADQDFQACQNMLKKLPETLVFDCDQQSAAQISPHLEKFIAKL